MNLIDCKKNSEKLESNPGIFKDCRAFLYKKEIPKKSLMQYLKETLDEQAKFPFLVQSKLEIYYQLWKKSITVNSTPKSPTWIVPQTNFP